MPLKLLERLYDNLKRVLGQSVALADKRGVPYENYNDFKDRKIFELTGLIRQDVYSLEIAKDHRLRAVPIYSGDRFYLLVICELQSEDIQKAQIITSLAELIISQFIAEYRPKPDAVDLLLSRVVYKSSSIDYEEFEQQLAALGYQINRQWTAVALELKGFWENYLSQVGLSKDEKENLISAKKSDISHALNSFFSRNQDNVIGYIGNDLFLVLKDLKDTDYRKFCQLLDKNYQQIISPLSNIHIKEITLAIGQSANNSFQLLESAVQAQQVLKIGQKLNGPNKVYSYEALGVLPLLLSGNTQSLKNFSAGALEGLRDPELISTLKAFLENNLNLTQTAAAVKIHRNTVIYRLEKISELIHKDPRNFPDAVELYLAHLFQRVLS